MLLLLFPVPLTRKGNTPKVTKKEKLLYFVKSHIILLVLGLSSLSVFIN